MKTHTTPTGIELLMPIVPKEAHKLLVDMYALPYLTYVCSDGSRAILLNTPKDLKGYTILGTCWREGDHKFFHNGFDPAELGFADFEFQDWLRSKGITIPEGFKLVLIKVN